MGKSFGISFSTHFEVSAQWLQSKGVLDVTLDVDTPLFIDPFLLGQSAQPEFRSAGLIKYEEHFTEVYRLLSLSEEIDDKAWQAALKKFKFSESMGLSGTCLGYSKSSTKGRGFGKVLAGKSLVWAKGVIKLGVKDPEMFSSLALFEPGIGADLISDMTTNIVLESILKFNERIYLEIERELDLSIPKSNFKLRGLSADLPINPFNSSGDPIILLPSDILKHLPSFEGSGSIAEVAESNAELRERLNTYISEVFRARTKKEKENLKKEAFVSAEAFQAFLDLLKKIESSPYDIRKDPEGLIAWVELAKRFTSLNKLKIEVSKAQSPVERIDAVCIEIIEQFQHLVEDCGLWKHLYDDEFEPRHERFAQLLFQAISRAYCTTNDLDIAPESNGGAGPVDFKLSYGSANVLIEIKLSTNTALIKGYEKQVAIYEKAESSQRAHFVVIDVGHLGNKWQRLQHILKNNPALAKRRRSWLVDGSVRNSASK